MKNRTIRLFSVALAVVSFAFSLCSVQVFASDTLGVAEITAYGKNKGVYLSWNEVDGATGYRVYQRVDGKWKRLSDTKDLNYTVNRLENAVQYRFAVKAYEKKDGALTWAEKFDTVKVKSGIGVPTVKATAKQTSIVLDWSEVYSAKGYRVYKYASGKWKAIKTTGGTSYTVTDLKKGKEYRFAVKAYVKENGKTVWADSFGQASATTVNYTPSKVNNVKVVSKGSYLEINWSYSKGAKGYKVYRSTTGKTGSYESIGTTASNRFTDTTVNKTNTYYYIIKAYSKFNGKTYYSSSSGKASGTLKAAVFTDKKELVFAKNNVVIREKPNASSKKMGLLVKGAGILRLSQSNNGWSKVNYTGNKSYYISTRFLTTTKPKNSALLSYNSSTGRLVVNPETKNWNLIVVNAYREIPADYKPVLDEILNTGSYLDKRVTPYYEKMYLAAKKDGLTLTPCSGYRSYQRQSELFYSRIEKAMKNDGLSKKEATKRVSTTTLPPGTSEHNLGIAMDITSIHNSFKNSPQFRWLQQNAHKYGFILRYTEENKSITGIIYEPWHWRFVGVEHAEKIKNSGLSLEQYLDKIGIAY